jgi:hypothetical protein
MLKLLLNRCKNLMIVGYVEYFIDCGPYVRLYDAVVCNPVKCAEVPMWTSYTW